MSATVCSYLILHKHEVYTRVAAQLSAAVVQNGRCLGCRHLPTMSSNRCRRLPHVAALWRILLASPHYYKDLVARRIGCSMWMDGAEALSENGAVTATAACCLPQRLALSACFTRSARPPALPAGRSAWGTHQPCCRLRPLTHPFCAANARHELLRSVLTSSSGRGVRSERAGEAAGGRRRDRPQCHQQWLATMGWAQANAQLITLIVTSLLEGTQKE